MFTRAQQTNNEWLVILIDQGLAVLSQNQVDTMAGQRS